MDLQKLETRIDWFAMQKVNHFSPTISPAPKNMERNEIESIEEALKFYAAKGVREVVIQPKYMGSYCDIYLHKNLNNTFFVSRNGHVIRHLDVKSMQEKCSDLHQKLSSYWAQGATMILIQSELMPWSALGKGLIEKEFEGYAHSHNLHLSFLRNSDIYQKVERVKQTTEYQTFIKDTKVLNEIELKEKYKMHIIRQYSALQDLQILDLNMYQKDIELYQSQVEIYGKEEELFFKPFNILKIVFENGKEQINQDNYKGFEAVSEDTQLLVNLEDMQQSCEIAYTFYNNLVADKYEGVMLKPLTTFIPNIPPAFKVRNNHYLQMIYGVNFRKDYEYYLERRNIRRKLDCSINDWALSFEMLKVPFESINEENYLLKLLCYKRIMQEEVENKLDTRL